MNTFLSDLPDGEPPLWGMYPLEFDAPCYHDWEEIWDDEVGLRCCFCMICGEYMIFEYDTEGDDE